MYFIFLVLHSLLRWLVLGSLLYAIYVSFRGVLKRQAFTAKANAIRHWTATIAHVQLLAGMTVYLQSPVVKATVAVVDPLWREHTFFKYVHSSLMIFAIVLVTIGSAKAKRVPGDQQKYTTVLKWFIAALVLLLIAIPWPFSPLAQRPYFRSF